MTQELSTELFRIGIEYRIINKMQLINSDTLLNNIIYYIQKVIIR